MMCFPFGSTVGSTGSFDLATGGVPSAATLSRTGPLRPSQRLKMAGISSEDVLKEF
jgi:hypothetical protein